MSEEAGNSSGRLLDRYVTGLRLAASFLTILPLAPRSQASEDEVAASFGLFPLVGFILGTALAAEDLALSLLFGTTIRSGLIILTLVVVTGALHLDALADTADALGARGNRDRALEILRDSKIGVFGAAAILLWLGLYWTALAALKGSTRTAAIYLAPGLGRWAMVAVSAGLDYLRPAGAGSFLKPEWSWSNLRIASAIAVIAIIPVFSSHTRAAAAAIVTALGARWFYHRWLGGVTGDLIGAAGAIAELAAILAMAARAH
ncbi:MAG: adenosylcobinamide-GDP ribazoletransferase [Candidatus Binataceae bacterium]